MSWWEDETIRHKNQRRGVLPQKESTRGPRHKQKRLWKVLGPSLFGRLAGSWERTYYRGVDRASCERFIEKYRRSYYVPRNATEAERARRQKLAETKANHLYIEGPEPIHEDANPPAKA